MLKHYFFSVAFFFSFNFLFSQTTDIAGSESQSLTLEKKLEGTYQIIVNDAKIQEVFTNDILKTIEEKRQEKNDVIYNVSSRTSILIFSREKINSTEFLKNKGK